MTPKFPTVQECDATNDAQNYCSRESKYFFSILLLDFLQSSILIYLTRKYRRMKIFFYCAMLICMVTALHAQDTTYFSVVQGKDIKGMQKSWMNGPHEYHFIYFYNDRGRGDSVYEVVRTANNGLITSVKIEGVDYYKNAYNESFEVSGDSVVWIVNGQRKAKPNKNELFANIEAPGILEPIIKALLQQPNLTTTAFNSGKIQILPLHSETISFKGKKLQLKLCEMYSNENNPPFFIWLTNENKFFAGVSGWFSQISQGYESLADTLLDIQEKQSLVYYGKQMNELSTALPAAFAVTHVRLFDAEHATMLNDMTVLVANGKIQSVGSSAEIKIPATYKVIDGSNKTLMPGLWDMHAHYDKSEGTLYIEGGVTHVRDMGNDDRLFMTRDAIRKNELLGPDISYMSGFIDQAGPYQGPTGTIAHSLQEALDGVDKYHRMGYNQIKLYSSVDPKWVTPIAAKAHGYGMRVAGHIPSFMTAAQAVNDGYNEITHMNMVMLNFMGDTVDTRSRGRFYAVGLRSKNIDLNSKEVNDFINLLIAKNISLDPTMNVFAEMFTLYAGDTAASIKPVVDWMPENEKQDVAVQTSFAPIEQKPTYMASYETMMKMLKKLYDNHILIVSGTDGGEAFALAHELELYVQAGIPPLNALQTATYNAAKDCNLLKQYGTIKQGYEADMILVNGNPAEDISDIRRVEWVVKNNRWYDSKKLFATRGWTYYY